VQAGSGHGARLAMARTRALGYLVFGSRQGCRGAFGGYTGRSWTAGAKGGEEKRGSRNGSRRVTKQPSVPKADIPKHRTW
jgi:hypothetical protein